jgi:hypothetical protein
MESMAYRTTYRGEPIWKPYRRNFKVSSLYLSPFPPVSLKFL